MAKYRLKDRALQGHLDAISGGEFTATLESGSFEFDKDDMALVTLGSSMHGTKIITGKFSVILHKDEVYELAEYTPNDWNRFPDVTPPEGVWMRVEQIFNNRSRRIGGIFRDGRWYGRHDIGGQYLDTTLDNVVRFRPWE